ncbi:uncharacterized protein B0T15DRAFT_193917 [Chaetomium strumarium]|uniref:Uncharacterized protein n=1 Tax=Chaetomium strumarium TaxID=1170767 RepID=A0AAJ0GSK3_9PEZI|nr:hypothetical protein B0T15DRAFT_193917 [Chaetomium strumarium]
MGVCGKAALSRACRDLDLRPRQPIPQTRAASTGTCWISRSYLHMALIHPQRPVFWGRFRPHPNRRIQPTLTRESKASLLVHHWLGGLLKSFYILPWRFCFKHRKKCDTPRTAATTGPRTCTNASKHGASYSAHPSTAHIYSISLAVVLQSRQR